MVPTPKTTKSEASYRYADGGDSGDWSSAPSSPPSSAAIDPQKSQCCSSLSDGESFEGYGENNDGIDYLPVAHQRKHRSTSNNNNMNSNNNNNNNNNNNHNNNKMNNNNNNSNSNSNNNSNNSNGDSNNNSNNNNNNTSNNSGDGPHVIVTLSSSDDGGGNNNNNNNNNNINNNNNNAVNNSGVELDLMPHGNSTPKNNDIGPSLLPRDNWTRSSLRRATTSNETNIANPRWGSMRHSRRRQLGSNALASQLYRSSSFNSSGRSSNCDANEDMYSDVSLENVQDLNYKLELLQRQVTDLADTQNIAEDRTTRTKTEYAVLQARYHMLEEQYRESELRNEERLAEDQKRQRETLARMEREAALQNENCQIKIKTIEIQANACRDEAQRLRVLYDKQANDLHRTQEKLELAQDQIVSLQQDVDEAKQRERKYHEDKKAAEMLMMELSKEMERLRSESGPALPTTSPETLRLEELHQELEEMRRKNRSLEEQNEELQATVLTRGVEEGRHLLNGTLNNLAQELEDMSQAQLQQAFQEKEEENTRLKHYIDTILLNIVENYPQLLEVKSMERK